MTNIQPITRSETAAALPLLPPRVQSYIEAIVRTSADGGWALVNVVLFGSAATGGFSETVSDVDLILVLPDSATSEDRHRLLSPHHATQWQTVSTVTRQRQLKKLERASYIVRINRHAISDGLTFV